MTEAQEHTSLIDELDALSLPTACDDLFMLPSAFALSSSAESPSTSYAAYTSTMQSPDDSLATFFSTPCFDDCAQACPDGESCTIGEQCWDAECTIDACDDLNHLQATACHDPSCDDPANAVDTTCYNSACLEVPSPDLFAHGHQPAICPPGDCHGFLPFTHQQLGFTTFLPNQACQQPWMFCGLPGHHGDFSMPDFGDSPEFNIPCANPQHHHPPVQRRKSRHGKKPSRAGGLHAACFHEHGHVHSHERKRRRLSIGSDGDDSTQDAGLRHSRTPSTYSINSVLTSPSNDFGALSLTGGFGGGTMSQSPPPSTPMSTNSVMSFDQNSFPLSNYNPHPTYQPSFLGMHGGMGILSTERTALKASPGTDAPSLDSEQKAPLQCQWILQRALDGQDEVRCNQTFADERALHEHINGDHVPQRTSEYFCSWAGCARIGNDFSHRTKLMRHVRGSHSKWHEFVCHFPLPATTAQHPPTLCGRTFATKEQLENHNNTHTGHKPFACSWPGCAHRSATKTQQSTHMRTHTKEKKYKCPVCGHGTGDSSNLSKHIRSKHPEWKRGEEGGEDGGGGKGG